MGKFAPKNEIFPILKGEDFIFRSKFFHDKVTKNMTERYYYKRKADWLGLWAKRPRFEVPIVYMKIHQSSRNAGKFQNATTFSFYIKQLSVYHIYIQSISMVAHSWLLILNLTLQEQSPNFRGKFNFNSKEI